MKKLFVVFGLLVGALSASASQVGVFCFMAAEGTETFCDQNVRVSLVMDNKGAMMVELENLTDSIIFVDRGRSFAWVNGESEPLFLMQSTTDSHTYSEGIAVGGGPHNVQWVSSESRTHSHTMYDQRIRAVAPHGTALINVWEKLPKLLDPMVITTGKIGTWYSCHNIGKFADSKRNFRKGDRRSYTRDTTPLALSVDIQYSFREFGESKMNATVSDYVSKIQIESRSWVSTDGVLKTDKMNYGPCFAFRSGKSVGTSIGEVVFTAGIVGLLILCADAEPEPEPLNGWNW